MLTQKEMSRDEFSAWKDANSWFFDTLKERQEEYQNAVDGLLTQFSTAPFSFTEEQKQILIAMNHRGQQIQDIIDIDYTDVVEVDNDAS